MFWYSRYKVLNNFKRRPNAKNRNQQQDTQNNTDVAQGFQPFVQPQTYRGQIHHANHSDNTQLQPGTFRPVEKMAKPPAKIVTKSGSERINVSEIFLNVGSIWPEKK